MSRIPAFLFILRKLWMVNRMTTARIDISISPARGDLNPKNKNDHKALRINCTLKRTKAIRVCFSCQPVRHTRNTAIPIKMYRPIQTGANTQSGGVKNGFLSEAYHTGIAGLVKIEPSQPASWQITMLITSLMISDPLPFPIRTSYRYADTYYRNLSSLLSSLHIESRPKHLNFYRHSGGKIG